jgi:hypothetical protein
MSVVFIGNSHLDQFSCNTMPLKSYILYSPGASIKGLINPHSITNLNNKISLYINNNNRLIFHLGQVDFEFGYYYKSAVNNVKLDKTEFITTIIKIYETYLINIPNPKIVIGLNPTVIDDLYHTFVVNFKDNMCSNINKQQETGEDNNTIKYSDLTHIYNDTIEERNCFLNEANKAMESMCIKLNIPFLNIWPILFDTTSNKINTYYHPGRLDHHIVPRKELQDILYNYVISTLF